MTKLNELPVEVQEKVKSTLEAYKEVHVTFSENEYHVSIGIMILNDYPNDYKFIGSYKADDFFNEDEKILNYVRNFHDYPVYYKGEKDWGLMNELSESGWGDNEIKVVMVDGNVRKAK